MSSSVPISDIRKREGPAVLDTPFCWKVLGYLIQATPDLKRPKQFSLGHIQESSFFSSFFFWGGGESLGL